MNIESAFLHNVVKIDGCSKSKKVVLNNWYFTAGPPGCSVSEFALRSFAITATNSFSMISNAAASNSFISVAMHQIRRRKPLDAVARRSSDTFLYFTDLTQTSQYGGGSS